MRKDNIEIKEMILSRLAAVEFTHTYAIGIRENGIVKAAIVEDADAILPMVTIAEPQASSHGSVWGVRMCGTRANMGIIKQYAREVVDLCSVAEFEREYAEHGNRGSNNRGHIFERMCAEVLGGKQADTMTAKCTECGDIVVNGEHIQCKLWNATMTTEPQVNRFWAERQAQG